MKTYCSFEQMISRRFLCLLLLIVSMLKVQAQEGFRIGPTAAFLSSRSSVIGSLPNYFSFRYKSGFSGGISAQYGFTQSFTLASGVSFVSKGYRIFNDTNNNGNLLRHNLSHIEVPLHMIFRIRMNTSSNMRGVVGMSFNSILSKDKHQEVNKGNNFVVREEMKNQYYPTLNLGAEIANEDKSGNIFCFGLYYKQSFSRNTLLNVYNTTNPTAEPNVVLGYRGSYISVGITYLFNPKNFKREAEVFY